MNCWCGHGPWHYQGYGYPPPYPPPAYYPPEEPNEPPRRRRRRRRPEAEDLENHLQDLQEEIDRVRRELAALRESGETES